MSVLSFRCLRCGECCRKLRKEHDPGVIQGLFLFPKEVKLVESLAKKRGLTISIKPQQAIGKIKHGKPRLKRIISYQIADPTCPFFDEKTNACTIYDERPTACRAFPITWIKHDTIVLAPDCTWSRKHGAKPHERLLIEGIDEELRSVSRIVSYVMKNIWVDSSPYGLGYNLRINAWQRGLKKKE